MNLEEQLKKIEEEIEKVKGTIKSTTEKEKIEEMKQKLIASLGEEGIEISSENIKSLLDEDRALYNLYNYYNQQQLSDYDLDTSDTEKFIKEETQKYNATISQLSAEVLVQTMNPEKITMELLEKLKGDKANSNSKKLFEQCLQKYATHIKPENVDEGFLNYLYQNGFRGEIKNPLINLTYKTFCDGKAKDERIQSLETKVEKQDELISYDEKVIGQLTKKINGLHEIISKAKETLQNIGSKINRIGTDAYNLGEKLEQEESKSVFKIISQRIKRVFSKTPMLTASRDCGDIYRDSQNIGYDTDKCKFLMKSYDEKESTQEINKVLRQRQSMKKSVDIEETTTKTDKDKSGVIEFYFEKEDGWEIGDR